MQSHPFVTLGSSGACNGIAHYALMKDTNLLPCRSQPCIWICPLENSKMCSQLQSISSDFSEGQAFPSSGGCTQASIHTQLLIICLWVFLYICCQWDYIPIWFFKKSTELYHPYIYFCFKTHLLSFVRFQDVISVTSKISGLN